jgi:DNA-directed RNA polymerase specialized sigma24 family protein
MKAPLLVEALRARDPGAPAALYDTHGESLFRYCWFILRSRDAAQVALRDTLVLAEAHIKKLRDPEMLRPWLYALARAECLRRQESAGAAHDAVIARPDQPDADRRLIAWHAVMSLAPAEREALELTIRHGMEAGQAARVMGVTAAGLQQILDRSRVHLEHALAGEILARHGVHGCPERAAALRGWAGELTVSLRERLVRHATSCQICHRYLPRNVAATKVFSLLPVPVPPQAMRLRVMTCFTDPDLVGYRMFVAGKLAGFGQAGFPDDDTPATPSLTSQPRATGIWTGPAAAVVAIAMLVAAVIAISKFGDFDTAVLGSSSATNDKPVAASPTVSGRGTGSKPARGQGPAEGDAASPSAESASGGPGGPTRLITRATSGPVPAQGPSPSSSSSSSGSSSSPTPVGGGGGAPTPGQLQVSPGHLDLGTGSTGQITLTASGGQVTWSASSGSADLTLSSDGGTISAGQQAVVTVTVSRAQDPSGQGTVTFGPGSEGGTGRWVGVTVTWSSSSSPPPPTPTVTPTVIVSSPKPSPPPARTPTPGPPESSAPAPAKTPVPGPANSPVVVSQGMRR